MQDFLVIGEMSWTFMKTLTKTMNALTIIIEVLIVVFMVLDVISMLIQVIGRELGIAPPWTEELSRYLMIWIALLGGAVIVRESGHIGIDIFISFIKSRKAKQIIVTLNYICTILVGIIMLYYGIYVTLENFEQISPALRIAFSWVYMSLPISGTLIIIFSLEQWLLRLKSIKK
ncbi:TRAP transporter small permease [Thermoanaerobacteraceae bacterium SP2]|nr:TRAP transporter small permease [Thermoanaerobacteraceae bacterium SP2]